MSRASDRSDTARELAAGGGAPRLRLSRTYLGAFVLMHLLVPLAFVPELFSWTGVALLIVGNYIYGGIGISLGFHRLFSHRALALPKWLERVVAVLGVCSLMETPARYAGTHRVHHQHADGEGDPHSPRVSFLWGHVQWLFLKDNRFSRRALARRLASDVLADPFYAWLEWGRHWLLLYLGHALLYFIAGALVGWFTSGRWDEAGRFGASLVLWGVVLRTVLVWHTIWAVNSVTHRWGYRNHETPDDSRNSLVLALLANGEGWHNNHHAHPSAASFGERWWEIDVTYLTIRLLEALGLATAVRHPTETR